MPTGFERGLDPCSVCGRSHAIHHCALCPEPELLCSHCSVLTRRGPRCIPHFQQRARLRVVAAAAGEIDEGMVMTANASIALEEARR